MQWLVVQILRETQKNQDEGREDILGRGIFAKIFVQWTIALSLNGIKNRNLRIISELIVMH
jgi:hypothetical protein